MLKNRAQALRDVIRHKSALAAAVSGADRAQIVNQIRWNRFQLVLHDRLVFLEGLQGTGFDAEVSRQIDAIYSLLGEPDPAR